MGVKAKGWLPSDLKLGYLQKWQGNETSAATSLATHPPARRPGRFGAAAREQGDGGRGTQHPAAAVGVGLGT